MKAPSGVLGEVCPLTVPTKDSKKDPNEPREIQFKKKFPIGPETIEIIKLAHHARLPLMLIGTTGVGKSEVARAAAEAMGIEVIVLDLSLQEAPDLLGLPRIEDDLTRYAPPAILPRKGFGLLILEELNRAQSQVLAPALQLLSARQLQEYVLPPGWSIVAAINPDDDPDYDVHVLDAAMRSRFLEIEVEAHLPSWLEWAHANGTHPSVLRLAERQDDFLSEVEPRRWTYASRLLHTMGELGMNDRQFRGAALCGYLPPAWSALLLEEDARFQEEKNVDAKELLRAGEESRRVTAVVERLRNEGRFDSLKRIFTDLLELVRGPELGFAIQTGEFDLDGFERALTAFPGDMRDSIQRAFGRNPIASRCLRVQPEAVLDRYSSGDRSSVRSWKLARRKHRGQALAVGLCALLESDEIRAAVAADPARKRRLTNVMDDLGEELARPLAEALQRAEIEPWAVEIF